MLTLVQWHQGFDSAMMECVWLDGAALQVDKPDLQYSPACCSKGLSDGEAVNDLLVVRGLTCLSAAEVMICSLPELGINLATYMLDVCPCAHAYYESGVCRLSASTEWFTVLTN